MISAYRIAVRRFSGLRICSSVMRARAGALTGAAATGVAVVS
jgi:hypothetical protein